MNVIDVAIKEIDKCEIPKGSNWGDDVQKYLSSVSINFPASWCMAFVYWCFTETCKFNECKNLLIKTASVLKQWEKIPAKYKFKSPLPGDIFIMDFGKGVGHTGIVESVSVDKINTIEGNTNDTGEREGYEVCRRNRRIASCVGFIRIPIEEK